MLCELLLSNYLSLDAFVKIFMKVSYLVQHCDYTVYLDKEIIRLETVSKDGSGSDWVNGGKFRCMRDDLAIFRNRTKGC